MVAKVVAKPFTLYRNFNGDETKVKSFSTHAEADYWCEKHNLAMYGDSQYLNPRTGTVFKLKEV